MLRLTRTTPLLSAVVLVLAACTGGGGAASPSASTGAASQTPASAAPSTAAASASASAAAVASIDPNSLLGKIVAAGKIKISTDPNYKPFSFQNPDGTYDGFDNATAVEVVKRLSQKVGKDIAIDWQTPSWDLITAGGWSGRWDISIGSMSVTVGRAKVVDFVNPYYYDSGAVAVPKDSTVQSISELNGGKTFCVGAATTYEQWLSGTLEIVDPAKLPAPTDAKVTSLPTDNECVQAVQSGRKFDAIVANANGLADQVADGLPIRVLDGPPIFTVSVAFALDKSGPSDQSLISVLNGIVDEMHADGTLSKLSMKYIKKDVTTKPGG